MAESLINYRVTSKDQNFYLNTDRIYGIQSLSINKNFGVSPLTYIGVGPRAINYIPRGSQVSVANINTYLINQDYFLQYVTGDSMVNAFILRSDSDTDPVYSMVHGYLNSYESQYSVGEIPTITTSINFIGNAGKIPTGNLSSAAMSNLEDIWSSNIITTGELTDEDWGAITSSVTSSDDWELITDAVTSSEDWNDSAFSIAAISSGQLLIPHGGSINLNIEDFQTNRVQSYQLQVTSNKVPVNNMGSRYAKRVELVYPIDVNCQFTFEVGNYQSRIMSGIPESPVIEDLTLTIRDYKTDLLISSYSFNNLNLISETYNMSSNSNNTVTVVYNTKIYGS